MKLQEKEEKKQKKANMYYGKLQHHFDEICKTKSLDKDELKNQMMKDFVEKHKDNISEKYYLKYYNDKDEILIYGDDGKYYELSDGSKINKRTFEKMFKSNKTGDIEINPFDFFNHNAINIKQHVKPINIKDFEKGKMEFSQTVKKLFDNIDTENINDLKKDTNIEIKTPIWNNVTPKFINQYATNLLRRMEKRKK